MARKTTKSSAAKKAATMTPEDLDRRVVDAALHLAAVQGWRDTTLADIAEEIRERPIHYLDALALLKLDLRLGTLPIAAHLFNDRLDLLVRKGHRRRSRSNEPAHAGRILDEMPQLRVGLRVLG